jgi:GH25 family lysozyme M1 (1,4-beta-N-acetylmuramidase)
MLIGFDVNHWKHPVPIEKLIDEYGAKYIIGKVTDGVSYANVYIQMYLDWKQRTEAKKVPFGSFHYWRVTKDAHAQADYYREKSGITNFPPIFDVEKYYNIGFYSRLENAKRLRKAIERTKINFASPRPLIYTSASHWLELTGNADFTDCDLWVANYGVVAPKIPVPWKVYKIWQYTDRYQSKYDANWFNGNEEDLRKFTGGTFQPVPPVDPLYFLGKILEVKVNAVNVRKGASTTYPIVETLRLGNEPIELEELIKSSNEVWARIGWNQWVAKKYNGNTYITYK